MTEMPDTWTCGCGNTNSNKFNHRVITVASDGPLGGESGYDVSRCLKCGLEKPMGRLWYDCGPPATATKPTADDITFKALMALADQYAEEIKQRIDGLNGIDVASIPITTESLKRGIEILKELDEMRAEIERAGFKWIPVTERLPDVTDIFIVTFLWDKIKEVTVTTSSYFKSRGWAIEKDNSGLNQGKVLAWMHKPKPYEPK